MEFLVLQQVKGYCPSTEDLAVRLGQRCSIGAGGGSPVRLDFYIGY
jgi:hypothetical protein